MVHIKNKNSHSIYLKRKISYLTSIPYNFILIVFYLQDKILFQRLEHICYTIETGEWPQIKKLFLAQTSDSCSTTPLDRSTPKLEMSDIESGESSFMEATKKTKPVAEYTSEVCYTFKFHSL